MKKLIAVLLVLLVAGAMVFACEHTNDGTTCAWCSAKFCAGAQAITGAAIGGTIGGTGGSLGGPIVSGTGAAAGAAAGFIAGGVAGFVDGFDGECFSD